MPFKLNISAKDGKSWKSELDSEILVSKRIGESINGKEISPDLTGYELQITGASDIAGFPHKKDVEGPELKKVLFTKKGWGMHKKPKWEGKKKVSTPKGLRLRKTVRGNQISEKTVQINLNITKEGSKKLPEIFPEQNKPKETPKEENSQQPQEQVKESPKEQPSTKTKSDDSSEKIEEEIKEEVAEELKDDLPTSPETNTPEKKEKAAEKVGEEVAEETEEVAEKIAEEEKKEDNS